MAELKTQPHAGDVQVYLDSLESAQQRADSYALVDLMRDVTGAEPAMWGDSIVGFGRYRYRYASGREGEWFLVGFAPRKRNMTLYIVAGFDNYADLLAQLGKHTTGKSCLYIKQLADVDTAVLRELVEQSTEHIARTNNPSSS